MLILSACIGKRNDINQAKTTVLSWFSYYANNPFSPHGKKPDLKHDDYWGLPGVEGTQISIIAQRIDIINAKYITDAYTLLKDRVEKLVQVTVEIHQLYYIDNSSASKKEKDIKLDFYLSNYNTQNGEYLILNHSPYNYDIYFEKAIVNYLRGSIGKTSHPKLRQMLMDAGMQSVK